jgi:hypothetical protein
MRRLGLISALAVFSLPVVPGYLAHAQPFVTLGPADELALDQPRVAVAVYDPGPPEVTFGPDLANSFLLDTGSSGLLAASLATGEMLANGYQTVAVYDEQGIGGTMPFDVSAPYSLAFAGTNGVPLVLPNVRLMSTTDQSLNLGGFGGIVGMPAMMGRVTTLDLTAMYDPGGLLGLGPMATVFPAGLPSGGGHRYSVGLNLVNFPASGQRNPGDPLPTFAPIPFAAVKVRQGSQQASGQFVVDTGAQITVLSSAVAFAAGLDANGNGSFDDEAIDFWPIGGVGQTVYLPRLALDSLHLPTEQGIDLVWTDLKVLIAEIDPSIGGLFGADLMTSGWLDAIVINLLGGSASGYVEQLHFNFAAGGDSADRMYLDINPDLDIVMPEPGCLALLGLAAAALLRRRRPGP